MTRPVVAVVPLRSPGVGKTRLAPALSPATRSSLASAMLADVVTALRHTEVDDVVVAAGGQAALELAGRLDVTAVADRFDAADLDAVLTAATSALGDDVDVMIVAADLPRLTAEDIEAVLACDAEVVCAPTNGDGTAALLRRPGGVIPTAYGVDSARRHRELARRAGARFARVVRDGFLHDVDTIDDVRALHSTMIGAATTRALQGMRPAM